VTFAGQMRLGQLLVGCGVVASTLSFDGLGLQALFGHDPLPGRLQSRLARFDGVVSWFGAHAPPFADRLRAVVPETIVAPPTPAGDTARVWEHLLETLRPWGVDSRGACSPLVAPAAWRSEARSTLSNLGVDDRLPLLVVHPGAGGEHKRWSADGFAGVVRAVTSQTGCQVLVHQGPADRLAVENLARALDRSAPRVIEPSLHMLAGLLSEARGYLGGDSGVSHLAAAFGAPAVILFPVATRERWRPWSPTAVPIAMPGEPDQISPVVEAVVAPLSATPTGARDRR
jgi:heptosyltransferase-2